MTGRGGNRPGDVVVALPMYDLPEVREATDTLWEAMAVRLQGGGIPAPRALPRPSDLAACWNDPRLVFAQTCGYPLMTRHHGHLRVLAVPVYAAPGCEGGMYRSAVIVRRDAGFRDPGDLRGRVCAVNSEASHSGCNALRHFLAPLVDSGCFFSGVLLSGSHRASLQAVREGKADVAAIDAVTLALIRRHASGEVEGIEVLAWTAPAPGLPYVAAVGRPPAESEQVRTALREVLADPTLASARAALLIDGVVEPDVLDYGRILEMEQEAVALGYPRLC
jgi:ABC-type phosphate/phosphonate transport system substrate-binding protein